MKIKTHNRKTSRSGEVSQSKNHEISPSNVLVYVFPAHRPLIYAIFNAKFLLRSWLSSIVNRSSLLSSLDSGVRGSLTITHYY
jgi:hypothetical protein